MNNWSYTVQGDDATRTAKVYDMNGNLVETRPYTQLENEEANSRMENDSRLLDLEVRLARLEAKVFPPKPAPETPDDPGVPDWDDFPNGIWFHNALLRDMGKVWRNISGTPLTSKPSDFPGDPSNWAHLFELVVDAPTEEPDPEPDPEPEPEPEPTPPVPAWSKDTDYKVGDRVTHLDEIWECLVAHGAERQGTWAPGVAHTIWKLVTA